MQDKPGPAPILLSPPSTTLSTVSHQFHGMISHDPNAVGAGANDHYLADHVREEEHMQDTGDTFIS